jgi:hypothetical protein
VCERAAVGTKVSIIVQVKEIITRRVIVQDINNKSHHHYLCAY